jgi:hypothetical protein
MILMSPFLLMTAHPAQSAEIELPAIQPTCKNISPVRLLPSTRMSPPQISVGFPSTELSSRREEVLALLSTKQWDQAWLKLQNQPSYISDEILADVLESMFQANEVQLAANYLIRTFPPQSNLRAEGIGTIAAEWTKRNQLPEALTLLKTLPQQSNNLPSAVEPVVRVLTLSNQIEKIPQVMGLFPEQQVRLWSEVSYDVPFEPEQTKQLASTIGDLSLRSFVLEQIASRWLSAFSPPPNSKIRQDILKGWKIANEIDACPRRISLLSQAFDLLNRSSLKVAKAQKIKSLNELEALVRAAELGKVDRANFQVRLAALNVQIGQKAQGVRLLEQVAESVKADKDPYFRISGRIAIASQYQKLGNASTALRLLDLAFKEVNQFAPKERLWERGINLWEMARLYRLFKQPQKATAIERRLPKFPKLAKPVPPVRFEVKPLPRP